MYLINTRTFELEEFASSSSVKYAILSHTWHNGEVLFHDMVKSNLDQAQEKPGFRKILYTCQQAAISGLDYAWVDTCCINKTSSAELSEAINSMFQWYKDAQVCYVYLNDLSRSQLAQMEESTESIEATFGKCRWFSRGWTLQELIAPSSVEFYDCEWEYIGSKQSLVAILSHVTGIDHAVLGGSIKSSDVTAGRRMSWASRRETTRVEDLTYSLLGIFDINMPIMYGEGNKAFLRLQEEILRVSGDVSVLAWRSTDSDQLFRGALAQHPKEFANCPNLHLLTQQFSIFSSAEIAVTYRGLRFSGYPVEPAQSRAYGDYSLYSLYLGALENQEEVYILLIRTLGGYVRIYPNEFQTSEPTTWSQLGGEASFTIVKDMDSRAAAKFESGLHKRLSLKKETENCYLRVLDAAPVAAWDRVNKQFILEGMANFLGAVLYSIRLRNGHYVSFVLVCSIALKPGSDPLGHYITSHPGGHSYLLGEEEGKDFLKQLNKGGMEVLAWVDKTGWAPQYMKDTIELREFDTVARISSSRISLSPVGTLATCTVSAAIRHSFAG